MRVTDQALNALVRAAETAHNLGDKPVNAYHLLVGLADAEGAARHVLGESAERVRHAPPPRSAAGFATAPEVADHAIRHAHAYGRDRATSADFLFAALDPADGPAAALLRAAGAEPATVRAALTDGDHLACCRENGVSETQASLIEMGSHADRMPGRGRTAARIVSYLLPYLLLWCIVLAVAWDTSGPEPVLATGSATVLLVLALAALVSPRRIRRSVARAPIDVPVPEGARPFLDRLGLRHLEVRIQPPPTRDRSHRLGRRAWIVLRADTERHPELARFVLWHEVAHLARRDSTARSLTAAAGCGLLGGAFDSFDLRAVAVAGLGMAVLTVGGRWWREIACDRFAVRHAGCAGFHAWADNIRYARTVLRLENKISPRMVFVGLLTHPPLQLRTALHRTGWPR